MRRDRVRYADDASKGIRIEKLRWGILSTADIGMSKVTPAIQRAANAEVVAIASRDDSRASAAAATLGIPQAYGSYEDLLAADDIDVVYIPLPNDLHAEWTIKAAAAGKHVLCEKPLAVSASQASEMVTACDNAGVLLAEAFMYRHHPSWLHVLDLVNNGTIGELQTVQSWFSYFNDDPTDIRNRLSNHGGALMDIGCYNIHLSRMLFGAEPVDLSALIRRDPASGVDIVTSAILEFDGGGQAGFTCSIRAEPDQRVHISGSRGRIEMDIPFNIPPDRPTHIRVTSGGDPPVAPDTETITFPPDDAYTIQAEIFGTAIIEDDDSRFRTDDAIANMAVIDTIFGTYTDHQHSTE